MFEGWIWVLIASCLRNIHVKPIWQMHISVQRFYPIMKSTDVESIFSIAKFLVGAFELRISITKVKINSFIIYRVMKDRKIFMNYTVWFISLVKI